MFDVYLVVLAKLSVNYQDAVHVGVWIKNTTISYLNYCDLHWKLGQKKTTSIDMVNDEAIR